MPAVPTGRGTLLLVAVGTALVLATYVTPMTTLSRTAASLGAGPSAQTWILSSMSVGLAAVLLASGAVGDAVGRRRVFVVGLVAMGLGSVVCAMAGDPWTFIGARVVEGAGGAAILACGLALLANTFAAGPARAHATGVWGASVGVGISVGAVLPAVVDGNGWRTTYVVIGLVSLALVVPGIRLITESASAEPRRLDVAGVVLLGAAMTCLVTALTEARSGASLLVLAMAGSSVVLLASFAWVESRVGEPLLELSLLREPSFLAATLGALVVGGGIIGMTSFVPTIVQQGLGGTLWNASVLILAWSLTSVAASLVVRRLPPHLSGAILMAVALVGVGLGQLLALGLTTASSPWRLAPSLLVAGVATGVLNAVLGREAVASVPSDRSAMGSGCNNTARYLGAAFGITLFSVISTHSGTGASGLVDGWNLAVLTAASISVGGAVVLAMVGRPRTSRSPVGSRLAK